MVVLSSSFCFSLLSLSEVHLVLMAKVLGENSETIVLIVSRSKICEAHIGHVVIALEFLLSILPKSMMVNLHALGVRQMLVTACCKKASLG